MNPSPIADRGRSEFEAQLGGGLRAADQARPSSGGSSGSVLYATLASENAGFAVVAHAVIGVTDVLGRQGFLVVEDNATPGAGADTIAVRFSPLGQTATCSQPPPVPDVHVITEGDIQVVEAQPSPTSKDQCNNGGWRRYATSRTRATAQLRRHRRSQPARQPSRLGVRGCTRRLAPTAAAASARLHAAVMERRLQLPDHDELHVHAANTIARHGRRGWRLDKPDERTPNDAVIAIAMAVDAVENRPEPVRVLGFV